MAAPVPDIRQVPAGYFLRNGYQALVTLRNAPNVELWEIQVTPPGFSYGEKIDLTTQHNAEIRTATYRALAELKDTKMKVAYDPKWYGRFLSFAGVNTGITITFPDGSTLALWGFLSDFEPEDLEEGKRPEATVTIKATNVDPSYTGWGPGLPGLGTGTAFGPNEFPPVYTVPQIGW
jgi:hypothetical protein